MIFQKPHQISAIVFITQEAKARAGNMIIIEKSVIKHNFSRIVDFWNRSPLFPIPTSITPTKTYLKELILLSSDLHICNYQIQKHITNITKKKFVLSTGWKLKSKSFLEGYMGRNIEVSNKAQVCNSKQHHSVDE